MKKLWLWPPVYFLRQGLTLYFDCRLAQAAACFAYCVLLTIFPVLICVSSALGMANIDVATVITQFEPFLPDIALDAISSYLRYLTYHQGTGLLVAGIIACWFSASAAYRTIARVMADVFRTPSQSILRDLIASIIFPVGLLVALDISVVVVVTGQNTLDFLAGKLPFLGQFLALWGWLRYVLLFAIFFLFILAILLMAAPRGTLRRPLMVSSLFATLALVVSSAVFSWFIGLSSRYSLVYGSLVSIIVLLVWLYLCGNILFLAIAFTGVWHRDRSK
ncbi:MAG: YihY/virulence factor BrkB family protein [Ruminiclostridium sp.]|nr:YihY/virulence factor BrkB family protein [Ruminiclostridium sp.]